MNYSTIFSALILCVSGFYVTAQTLDDFSDGDFTSNPAWTGDASVFEVSNNELRLNNTSPASSNDHYLSTGVTVFSNMVWEFYVKLDFNPSSTNQAFVYLFSSQAALTGSLNGYFVQIGNTAKEISLYRQSGTTKTILINGTDNTLNTSTPTMRIKVTRSSAGEWKLYRDLTAGTNYVLEGSATDVTHTSGSYFGVYCDYTNAAGRSTGFHFDDFVTDQMKISSITTKSATQIEANFNQDLIQTNAETITNYTISGITILSAVRDATTKSKVTLTFDGGTPLTTNNYTLQVGTGLTEYNTTQKDFSYLQLGLSGTTTLSSTSLRLTFNDDLKQSAAETISNYSVDNGIGTPTSATLSGSGSKQVELTFGNTFSDGINYQLNLSGIQNSSGNSSLTTTASFSFVLPLILQSASAISVNTILVSFNKELNQASAETTSNYSVNNSIGTPISAILQSDQKSVLLTLNTSLVSGNYTVSVSNVQDTGANTISATDNSASFSYTPLVISTISQASSTTLTLTFNQSVDETSALLTSNYTLNNSGTVTSAAWSSGTASQVTLTVSGMANSTYTLTVDGVKNGSGNAIASSLTKSFDFNKATPQRGIILTEVMADYTVPTGRTPTSYSGEYVELYNPGSVPIRLENFRLNNEKLPAYTLNPASYVVVVDNSSYSSFSSIISNVIQVTNFDALSTPSDSVILRDQYRNLVDSIYYSSTWFDDAIKDDGGYSLELINPNLTCSENNNWTATLSSTGGTPGVQNSVYSTAPGTTAPTLTSLSVTSSKLLTLVFSKPLDQSTVVTGSFSLSGNTIAAVSRTNFTTFKVTLANDLVSETTNTLNFQNIKDCSGNPLATGSKTFRYDVSGPKLKDLVVLSQNQLSVLFHEQLNKSVAEDKRNFKLSGLEPTRSTLQDTARYRVQLTFESDFIPNMPYSLVCSNLKDTLGNVTTSTDTSFTYQSIVDSTLMISGNLGMVFFKEKPKPSSVVKSNFLVSGTIGNPTSVWIDKEDSTKVLLAFGKNLNENSSYTLYMERLDSKTSGRRMMTPARRLLYDTKSPTYVSLLIESDSVVKVTYDEPLNIQKASASSLYSLEDGSVPKRVSISGKTITLTFGTKFLQEIPKRLTIQRGISDLLGNTTTSSRNIDFTYDRRPPRILSSLYEGTGVFAFTLNEKVGTDVKTLSNYLLEGIHPASVTQSGPDSLTFKLTFAGFSETGLVSITVKNLVDLSGNVTSDTTIILNTLEARLRNLLVKNDSVIEISFNRPMSTSVAGVSNYSVDGNTVKGISTADNQTVLITLYNRFINGSSYVLRFSGITDQSGTNLIDSSTPFQVTTRFQSYKFLNNKTLELRYSTPLTSISGDSFLLDGQSPLLVQIDGTDPSIVRLVFSTAQPENVNLGLIWKDLQDKYGRRLPDWGISVRYDTQAPAISSVTSDFFGVIYVGFNEPMDKSSSESTNLWSIMGIGAPGSAILSGSTVKLDFKDRLTSGITYQLITTDVADAAGNFLKDTISFLYTPPALPQKGDILITEIMADPTPVVGLPDAEYVELLNVSSKPINLKTLRLVDPSAKATLPDYELAPGAYVLLVSSGSYNLFSITNKVSVTGFPSLGNSGDSLVLTTVFNQLIDRVKYDLTWYKDTGKQDGGYSLELINPSSKCPSRDNWKASTSVTGGTPGFQNAVFSIKPDEILPSVKSFSLVGNTGIRITFSESMDSLSLVNATYSVDGLSVGSVSVTDAFRESVQLTFTESIPGGKLYELKVSGAKDCSGNELALATLTFGIGRVPDPRELLITEIMADPDPVVQLPNSEYLELYNNTNDLLSLSGLKLYDATGSVILGNHSIPARSYALLVPSTTTSSFSGYGQVIPVSGWLSLNNTGELLMIKHEATLIDKVWYSPTWYKNANKSDGGYSLERINPESGCPGGSNWTASDDPKGGTPGSQNSVYSLNPDTTPPTILAIESVNAAQVRITFNEPMDSLSLIKGSYFSTRLPVPKAQVIDANVTSVLLSFDLAPETGIIYRLTLSNLTDCSGNALPTTEVTFGIGRAPKFGELLITEIMADPDPVVQLPNSEYLEIYNNSADLISLAGMKLSDATGSVNLPAISIESGKYLILCPSSSEATFSAYGRAKGVSGWLSLTNAGERLTLTYNSSTIFSIAFSDKWHDSAEKSSGGYSLEMRDFSNVCGEKYNWGSSIDPKGGTPGQPNSILGSVPDSFGPNLLTIFVNSSHDLTLTFDESIRVGEVTTMTISPEVNITSFVPASDDKSLRVTLTDDLTENVVYTLTLTGITDCKGNPIQTNSATFTRPDGAVEAGMILLSELLSDPKTGGVDFVEIHNVSNKYIDLSGWKLAREVKGELTQKYPLSTTQYVIKPGQYVALSTDADRLILDFPKGKSENFLEMNSMPTLPNDEGNVVLLDSSGNERDRLDYDVDMHTSLLKSTDGVSLERISFVAPTNDANNWRSASSTVGFGTPGYMNSQRFESAALVGVLGIEPRVFVPGSSSIGMQSFTTINYEFDQPGKFATVTVFDQNGRQVALLASNASLSTSGFFQWDGTDMAGQAVRMGYYVVLFEIYDSTGKKDVMKETVVVGR